MAPPRSDDKTLIEKTKTHSPSISKSKRSRLDEPIAPDGGWGWVILFASFLSAVIVDGVCFSFGIFYLEFLSFYGENKGKTAWIGSVLNGTYMIMGPIAAALAKRFGCRSVAIAGSIWSAAAFILATFSPSVDILIVTYGVLGGMGFGLIYLPSIVIVQYYFDKRRAFATGVATCGSGIGAIIFAPLSKYLIDQYAWKGAQWIIAAIVLNGMVLGCVYRPLTFRELERIRRRWQRKQEQQERRKLEVDILNSNLNIESLNKQNLSEDKYVNSNYSITQKNNRAIPKHLLTNGAVKTTVSANSTPDSAQMTVSTASIPTTTKQEADDALIGSKHSVHTVHEFMSERDCRQYIGIRRRRTISDQNEDILRHAGIGSSWHSLESIVATAVGENSHKDADNISNSSVTPESEFTEHEDDNALDVVKDLVRGIKETMDFSMMKDPVFVIYGVSCIFSMAGFFVPFTYLPDRAEGLGYGSARGAMLLSCLGIANTVGRVLAGWASDQPWADCLVINNLALILGGLTTIICPHLENYWLLVAYSLIFGSCIAAFVTLRSIILVDLIGLDKLASGLGLVVLCQGISSFVGSPLAGALYDATGTFHMSFYAAGTFIALSGVICTPLRKISRWKKEYEKAKKEQHMDKELELNMPLTSV